MPQAHITNLMQIITHIIHHPNIPAHHHHHDSSRLDIQLQRRWRDRANY
jgi:hypothetical protein